MFISIIGGVAIALISIFIVIQVVGIASLLLAGSKTPQKAQEELPKVSVLVAARNEESNLRDCLNSLRKINYPEDKIEFVIGNDRSEDTTGEIAEEFAKRDNRFKIFHLDGSEHPQTKGKARVLAFLANQAQGEYLFITDADISINPEWINELLLHFEEKTTLVSGLTMVESNGLFSGMQSMDWLYFMSLINGFSYLNMGVTAVGNNMAVKADAYKETGGYEKMPFSITEDYKLYKTLRSLGYKTKNLLTPDSVVMSKPIPGLVEWLYQRKRWLKGGLELPIYWKAVLLVLALYYFAMIALFFINLKLWVTFWFVKFSLQSLQMLFVSQLLGKKPYRIFSLLFYDLYLYIGMPLMALFFLYPGKVLWKGRKF